MMPKHLQTRGALQVIVGGQAGSEGKGAVAAYLARELRDGLAIRVAGPNAGHSAVDDNGTKWALRQIPVAAVTNPDANLAIAAGSEIDLQVLTDEIERLEDGGHKIRHRLTIDPAATILTRDHQTREQMAGIQTRLGSTSKGIGAARADRIMRLARTVREVAETEDIHGLGQVGRVAPIVEAVLRGYGTVQVEGTQGYQLGLHTDNYPQTTSSDCRAIDMLSMAGISPWADLVRNLQVWVVFRAHPIRVAGNSGPLPNETTWQELNLPEELTTVTRKTRRVGTWDDAWARAAMKANGHPSDSIHVALTMLDQVAPAVAGATTVREIEADKTASDFVDQVENAISAEITLVGTSDRTMVDYQ